MKISCILPVYNGADRVSKSIESILNQTFKDFELIIVNDGSTDNTAKIIDEYAQKDSRIKVIHQENKTLPGALNTGFAAAQGDYHTWTSDDNLYKPQAFEKLLEKMQENPNVDIGYGRYILWKNNKIQKVSSIKNQSKIVEKYIVGAYFLYKKEVFEKLDGYDINLFCAEDYDFFLRADANGFIIKGFNITEYDYYIREGSLTTNQRIKVFEGTKKALLRYIQLKKCSKIQIAQIYIKLTTFKGVEKQLDLLKYGIKEVGLLRLIIASIVNLRFVRFLKLLMST